MKNKRIILGSSLLALCLPFLAACSNSEKVTTLRILNMEDYIYLYEEDPEEDTETPEEDRMDLVDQFARDMEEKYPEMGKIQVIYTTTDTNETLYNEIKTGKAVYDVICPSDYMIQKLIIDDLLVPLDKSLIPNYFDDEVSEVCSYVKEQFGQITAPNLKKGTTEKVDDYGVGYMWGTLGILYNPEFEGFGDEELHERIHEDVKEWDMLWNPDYNGTISIKNSMRDTYAVGILKAYEEELKAYKESHSLEEYTSFLAEVFNSFEQENVNEVRKQLDELKKNVFGLEVDSGKLDIATGKIGINIAWSGDAVYSMELADGYDKDLYYAIPELGSNVWFDGWVMPKRPNSNPRSENENILAHEFLNFLCDPHVAKENMEYTGYTSFIAGEEVRDYVRDCYDSRTDFLYFYDEENEEYYEVFYELEGQEIPLEYEDFEPTTHEPINDDLPLYYNNADGEKCVFYHPYLEDETPVTYGDITIEKLLENEDVQIVDLEYFFGGEEYNYRFYSSLYLPFEDNDSAGLDFFCQFPSEETIKRCAVMAFDYKNNDRVVKMWEDFKSDPLPVWAIILFAVEIIGIGGFILYITLNKRIKKKIREKRLSEK